MKFWFDPEHVSFVLLVESPKSDLTWKVKHGKYPWYSNRSKVFGWGYKSLAVPFYVAWLLSVSNFERFRVEPQKQQQVPTVPKKEISDLRDMLRTPLGHSHRSPGFWSGLWIGDSPERCVHWLEPQGRVEIGAWIAESFKINPKLACLVLKPTICF
jgi:hypothetical protein